MIEDVLERIEQFYPDELCEEEKQDFCEWWRSLSGETQLQARQLSPMDAMVADVASYDRRTAYVLTCNAHDGYLQAMRQCMRLKNELAGTKAANRMLMRELDRRFEK